AFTIVVLILCNGTVLPFQTIHQGYTKKSCPAPTSKNHDQCINANFRFEYFKDTNLLVHPGDNVDAG
ncbi:hypothetical protein DFH29DRAFT_805972, partial [Suillus ampliporus]